MTVAPARAHSPKSPPADPARPEGQLDPSRADAPSAASAASTPPEHAATTLAEAVRLAHTARAGDPSEPTRTLPPSPPSSDEAYDLACTD